MAASIASYVKRIIDRSPFLSDMLIQDIASYSNLALSIKPKVEELYGSSVSTSSIVMAIRRYADELRAKPRGKRSEDIGYEIQMKTNIYDVNLHRDDRFVSKLPEIYGSVHPENGDFINVTIGSHEITLSVSENARSNVDRILSDFEIVHSYTDLVALTILFHGDYIQTPGITYLAVRKLAWEHINIIEIVSTMNVLTFVVGKDDSSRAYEALNAFLSDEL